jgi:hypothetical protein
LNKIKRWTLHNMRFASVWHSYKTEHLYFLLIFGNFKLLYFLFHTERKAQNRYGQCNKTPIPE